jgi:hypothetical protein
MPSNSTASGFGIKVFGYLKSGTCLVVSDTYRIVADSESLLIHSEAQGFQGWYKLFRLSLDVEVLNWRERKR